jgi:hypothetical protein
MFAKQMLYCFNHTSSLFSLVILEMETLFGLASNLNPPDFSLPSSWDYKHEPLVPGLSFIFEE